jgi:hypothetical protein
VQGGRRGSEAAMAFDGIEYLQQIERNLHVKNIKRIGENCSLLLIERLD